MIPTASDFPDAFDTDENLFLVHDFLRLRLVDDYNPGDTSIITEGDLLILDRFPTTGIITLTEQCSDPKERGVSYHYSEIDVDTGVISGLEILPDFPDVFKPKRITNVTMNVMARHHNHLKEALIAIEEFIGIKGTTDVIPFGPTLEGRINFLRNLVLIPRAWFTSNKRTGIIPLEIEFEERAFRLATDTTEMPVEFCWNFGDQTTSVFSTISATDEVPPGAIDVIVCDEDGGKIRKTYLTPGIYTVSLTVRNSFGEDTVTFEEYVTARIKAPDEAIIRIEEGPNQEATPGVPPDGPFDIPPSIRSPINTLISLRIPQGENPATPGISYGGELLNDADQPIDPIEFHNWVLGDDLDHPNNSQTTASYSIGGIYDLKLRVDTELGAYRITTYEDSIDIIENQNLWLWVFQSPNVRSFEFGLISETFKLTPAVAFDVDRNSTFLDGVANETEQKREFAKNTGFAPRGSLESGLGGSALLMHATGRNAVDPIASEEIGISEYNGFLGTYISRSPITRPWNWVNFNSFGTAFFSFGTPTVAPLPFESPTNDIKTEMSLNDFGTTNTTLTGGNFSNGAEELLINPSVFDGAGDSEFGHYSVTRSAFKDNTGYILRNDGVGSFFRLRSFYRTEGTIGTPFQTVRKMPDIQGPTKLEGNLTNLTSGIFFFNNSGSVSAFNDTTDTWSVGGAGVNSSLYRQLQDTSVPGFDSDENTLLVASDGDRRAYLSFDYSPNAFIKFNEIGLVFSSVVSRPDGEQWIMGIS